MTQILSLLFVILWSSAFITSKVIVDNASPFASLSFRFILVGLGFLFFSFYLKEKIFVKLKYIFEASLSGILFHGLYLGGVFYSISIGLPASISALIVSMHPILTNILAGPILNEKVTWKQWIGIILAFSGTLIVLGFDVGENEFENSVLEESANKLVIVDFWAPWCGPCKQLTPILEKIISSSPDKIILAKINIDENQQIAAQLRIQSIPAVFAFKDKQLVNAFQGVIPEKEIITFLIT